MLTRLKRLPSPASVIAFIALVAVLGTGSAVALQGQNTVDQGDLKANSVGASEIKANGVGGSELNNNAVGSAEVGADSLTGSDINESTLNISSPPPPSGGGLTPFTATLGANDTKSTTIGNFTISSATNNAGTCGAIQLQAGTLDSQRSIGLNAAFANLASNATATITAANVSQAFTAVSDDGTSTVSGVVGRAQQGNTCLITGYLAG
jgi:hypothetical protein